MFLPIGKEKGQPFQNEKTADRSRANPVHSGAGLPQRRDERQGCGKGIKSGVCQADRQAENTQPAVSCIEEEAKEAKQIRKSVYSILRQKQQEQQSRRAQDVER